MARLRASKCKLCRREGEKLFLKGRRCETSKCPLEKGRSYPPGQHGLRREKDSEYALRLREKQKVKKNYGVGEAQFRRYFSLANRKKGMTGENLLLILERRLDNLVYRLGLAPSRFSARQLIRHGHFTVKGKKVSIPSYSVKPGEIIKVREKSKELIPIKDAIERAKEKGVLPAWLEVNYENLSGSLKSLPNREELGLPFKEQLIVEFYSR